jgi:hypothetical protein
VLSSEWNTLDRWLFFVQKTHSQALLFAGLPRQGPQPAGFWGAHEHEPGDWGCVNCSQAVPRTPTCLFLSQAIPFCSVRCPVLFHFRPGSGPMAFVRLG